MNLITWDLFFSERIVPRAVLYFTGEALDSDSEDEYDEEDSDEDDDEDGKYLFFLMSN